MPVVTLIEQGLATLDHCHPEAAKAIRRALQEGADCKAQLAAQTNRKAAYAPVQRANDAVQAARYAFDAQEKHMHRIAHLEPHERAETLAKYNDAWRALRDARAAAALALSEYTAAKGGQGADGSDAKK